MMIQIPAQDEEKQPQMGLVQDIGRAGDLLASRPFGGRDIGMYQSEDWYMQPPPGGCNVDSNPRAGCRKAAPNGAAFLHGRSAGI